MMTIKLAALYPKSFVVTVRNAREEKIFEQHFARTKKQMRAIEKRQVLK